MLNKLTSSSLVSNMFHLFKFSKFDKFKVRLNLTIRSLIFTILQSITFLPSYYRMNEKVWLEGLLVDWLQKSIFDKWVKRFLVHSCYLVNERVIFDIVVRFYIDYVIWFSNLNNIWNVKSVTSLLTFLILSLGLFITVLVLTNLLYTIL